jgi:hypothetical protein
LGKSKLTDFYQAKGQYDMYRRGLNREKIGRKLFLAIEDEIYQSFFQKSIIQETIIEEGISLIIFNISAQKIVQWIKN